MNRALHAARRLQRAADPAQGRQQQGTQFHSFSIKELAKGYIDTVIENPPAGSHRHKRAIRFGVVNVASMMLLPI